MIVQLFIHGEDLRRIHRQDSEIFHRVFREGEWPNRDSFLGKAAAPASKLQNPRLLHVHSVCSSPQSIQNLIWIYCRLLHIGSGIQ